MKHWQLKCQVLKINQVLRICNAGGKSAHPDAKFHPSSWPEFILNSIFITSRQILSLEKFRLNKRAVKPFQSMPFFDSGRFNLEIHQIIFKKNWMHSLCVEPMGDREAGDSRPTWPSSIECFLFRAWLLAGGGVGHLRRPLVVCELYRLPKAEDR